MLVIIIIFLAFLILNNFNLFLSLNFKSIIIKSGLFASSPLMRQFNIALSLFIHSSPILGIVGFLVAYELIRRASINTGTDAIKRYLPSEENKAKKMEQYQPSQSTPDVTLEEEMIDNMVEFTENNDLPETNVKPVLGNNYGAEEL